MKKLLSLFALSLLGSHVARAESEEWYLSFSLGLGLRQYPQSLSSRIEAIRNPDSSAPVSTIDIGVYWPIADQHLFVGPAINSSIVAYPDDVEIEDFAGFTRTAYLFSTYWSPLETELGNGLFVRGDVGFYMGELRDDHRGLSSWFGTGSLGFGAMIGAGYGFSFGGTRLTLSITQSLSRASSETVGSTSFNVGGVF